jgi:hypothetical protein
MNERERLANLYAGLTDEELIQIGSQFDLLTDEAQVLLREEFDRRSLEAPELEEPANSFELQELVTIRTFRDPADALMAKSVLDSADLPCERRKYDPHLMGLVKSDRWNPFTGTASRR